MADINEINKLEKEFATELGLNSKYYYNPKIKGKHKKFDTKLWAKYDVPARKKIKEILGDIVKDNPNEVMQDLIINLPKCKYQFLELQVITNWIHDYPYQTLYIYETKGKYGYDTLFLTLNKNMTEGYLFDRKSFAEQEPRRLKKYSRLFVYDIPWNKVAKIYTDSLDKESILFY